MLGRPEIPKRADAGSRWRMVWRPAGSPQPSVRAEEARGMSSDDSTGTVRSVPIHKARSTFPTNLTHTRWPLTSLRGSC